MLLKTFGLKVNYTSKTRGKKPLLETFSSVVISQRFVRLVCSETSHKPAQRLGDRVRLEKTGYCVLCPSAHLLLKLCQSVGAGDRHPTPERAASRTCLCATASHTALGLGPVLLMTVWAACANPLPQERGQAQQKAALVLTALTMGGLCTRRLELNGAFK